jgi:signal transduction histidine kinase
MTSHVAPSPRPVAPSLRPVVAGAALYGRAAAAVILFCAVYALVLSVDQTTGGPPRSLAAYLAAFRFALELFVPGYAVVAVASAWTRRARPPLRAGILAPGLALAVVASYAAIRQTQVGLNEFHASLLPLVFVGWLGLTIFFQRERAARAEQSLHEMRERRLELERQLAEAQLRTLQSQVEPHFLFNTLAHLRRLYQTDFPAGQAMLRHLGRYLRAARSAMGEPGIPLARDLELAVAYLNIQKVRMGPRLAFSVDVADALMPCLLPPLTLTTLVENAIKHGLSALAEGGTVRIEARASDGVAVIDVVDDGVGFQSSIGTGVGLANVRARLGLLYGGDAGLSLLTNDPRGVTARIVARLGAAQGR